MVKQQYLKRLSLVLVTLLPLILIWGVAELYLYNHSRLEMREEISHELTNIRSRLEQNLYSNLLILNSLVAVVKTQPDINQQQFSELASHLDLSDGIVRNIAVAPGLVIQSIYPLQGNEAALGLDYRKNKAQWGAVKKAIETRQIQIAGPLELVQGGFGIIARKAVFMPDEAGGERLWGIISTVMDADELFRLSGMAASDLRFALAMRGVDGSGAQGKVFYGSPALFDEQAISVEVDLPVGKWLLAGASKSGSHDSIYDDWLLAIRLISLLALAFAIGFLWYKTRSDREKHQTSLALRESERRFQDLVENTHDWIWEVDANGVYRYVSPRVKDLLGYEVEEVLGKTPFDFMQPAEAERVGALFQAFAREKQPFNSLENSNRHKDGHEVVLDTSGTPILSAQGELLGYRGTDRDITDRKQMERKLEKEQIFNEKLVQAAGSVIIVLDHRGHIVKFNQAAENITGYRFAELKDKPIWQTLIPESVRDDVKQVFAQLTVGDIVSNHQNEWQMKDGSLRMFDWYNTVITDEQGNITHTLSHGYDITEKIEMQETLIQNNQRFYHMFELSPDPVWLIREGLFVDCNLAAVEMMGYASKQALLNKHPSELSPKYQPDGMLSRDKAEQMIEQAIKKGLNRFEWVHTKADGSEFYAEVTLSLILLNQQQVLYCSWQDISNRKGAELALKESEARFRSMFDSANIGILLADVETLQFVDANRAICQMLGFSKQELLQQSLGRLHTSAELPHALALFKQYSEGELHTVSEVQVKHKSGDELSMAINASVLSINGRPTVIGYFHDISRQKQDEKELETYRNELEQLVVNRTHELENAESIAHVGSWNLDIKADQLRWSKETYHIFGLSEDQPVSLQTVISCVHPDDRDMLLAAWNNALEGAPYHFLHRIIVNGKTRWVEEKAVINFDDDGNAVSASGTVQDITRQKEVNEQLEKARIKAESSARARSEFIANMSHEIRTPLNAVLGLARMGRHCDSTDKALRLFQRIDQSGNYLLSLINDILDFSRINADKIQLEKSPFDLRLMLDKTIEIIRHQAVDKGLELKLTVDDDLSQWVQGDSLRIKQILLNLLSNAIKFTEHGQVDLSVDQTEQGIRFVVADSGIGIDEEVLPTLFSAFTQADSSTTRKFGGTGLGLNISQNLVRLMGGEISASSQSGQGSEFTVVLPLQSAAAEPQSEAAITQDSCKRLAGLHILSAEDNEINRMVLEDLLLQLGATVEFAENGKLAVERVHDKGAQAFDLILMDIQMPEMDGHEATRRILEFAPELPIIGLTAHAFAEERERCYQSGMLAHITKPINQQQLCDAIVQALSANKDSIQRSASADKADSDAKPAVASSEDLIDWDKMYQRYQQREAFILKLLQTVLQNEQTTAERILGAIAQKDFAALRERAHALKGMAGNIFADALLQQAKQTENLSRQQDPAALDAAERLLHILAQVLRVLENKIESITLDLD